MVSSETAIHEAPSASERLTAAFAGSSVVVSSTRLPVWAVERDYPKVDALPLEVSIYPAAASIHRLARPWLSTQIPDVHAECDVPQDILLLAVFVKGQAFVSLFHAS